MGKDKKVICINAILLFASMGVVATYIFFWRTKPALMHFEIIANVKHFLGTEMSGFKDMLHKSFNLDMIEDGQYRPRIMAFVIQYLDIKGWKILNQIFPWWGGRFPMTLVAIPICMGGAYTILRKLFKESSQELCIFVSSLFLFLPNYQATTYFFMRTAKLIAPGIALCVIGLFFCKREYMQPLKEFNIKNIIYIVLLFILSTVDEQILAVLVILLGATLFDSIMKQKSTRWLHIYTETIVFYCIYHLTWGKMLFQHFTPEPLKQHPHTFMKVIENWPHYIRNGFMMYAGAVSHLFFDNTVIIIAMLLIYSYLIYRTKEKKECILSFYFMVMGICLSICLVTAHPIIITLYEQKKGMYYNIPILLFIIGYLYAWSIQEIKGNKITAIALLFLINFIFIYTHIDAIHLTHATEDGKPALTNEEEYNNFLNSDVAMKHHITESYFNNMLKTSTDYEAYMNR